MENGKMNVELVSEILDRQPSVTTLVQRTCSEDFGDERLLEAANPGYAGSEEEWDNLLEEVRAVDKEDAGLMFKVEDVVNHWRGESEIAAYRLGIIVGLRLAGKGNLIPEVAQQI